MLLGNAYAYKPFKKPSLWISFYYLQSMSDRHDQFAGKNAALGRAWATNSSNSKPASPISTNPPTNKNLEPAKCEKCGEMRILKSVRWQQHDRTEGVASYGVQIKKLCEKCAPAPKVDKVTPQLSDKAIRSLLRGAKKAL